VTHEVEVDESYKPKEVPRPTSVEKLADLLKD
jgi:hypothetical protein